MPETITRAPSLSARIAERLIARNALSRTFFEREADRLAAICDAMAERFLRGGRLIAFGRGAAATDAQHVAVEFVHPVIVGKRALPAVDLSASFECALAPIVSEADVVIGFSGVEADAAVSGAVSCARSKGALTLALPGRGAEFSVDPPAADAFVSQELIEVLYHTLWETVHVFLEHRERSAGNGDDLGASGFLYPFLGGAPEAASAVMTDVARSIRAKAADDERLRAQAAREQGAQIADAAAEIFQRIRQGATLLPFGNGGSATDANDWAIDCASIGIPAISLAMEPANVTAIANDIGVEAIFLRQLIAHGRPGDVVAAISTSGGSSNVIAALEEARRRGMMTVALLGYDGGEILRRRLADWPIVVACDYIPRIQEVQASIYHAMTESWREWQG